MEHVRKIEHSTKRLFHFLLFIFFFVSMRVCFHHSQWDVSEREKKRESGDETKNCNSIQTLLRCMNRDVFAFRIQVFSLFHLIRHLIENLQTHLKLSFTTRDLCFKGCYIATFGGKLIQMFFAKIWYKSYSLSFNKFKHFCLVFSQA